MEPGTKISHYEIAAKLGQGGMGVVYKAWDQKLKRAVALKFLPASGEGPNPHAARFHQEALAVSALNHPNIATIYDIDECDGHPFLALEYLPGGTLDSWAPRCDGPRSYARRRCVRVQPCGDGGLYLHLARVL